MEVKEEIEALQSIYKAEELHHTENLEDSTHSLTFAVNGQRIVTLTLHGNYPSEPPLILLPDHLHNVGLKEHLMKAMHNLVGSPMLFDVLEAAKEWMDGHPLCLQPIIASGSTGSPQRSPQPTSLGNDSSCKDSGAQRNVCKFYKQGKCRFGDKCRNFHPGSKPTKQEDSVDQPSQSTTSPNKKSTKVGQISQSRSRSPNKLDSQEVTVKVKHTKDNDEESEYSQKKIPMRKASDVISRILWDPDLPTEEFTVGYLDRFVGIIEKPFNAFSWEDISTVGINVLAVPRHRIQYFKYRNEIVWDKRNQMDNFFGSRGGKVIQDIVKQHQDAENTTAAAKPSGDSKATTSDPINTSDKLQEALFEDEDDTDAHRGKTYSDKNRPTHFVCVHITDPLVVSDVDTIQTHIISHSPELGEGCLPLTALHVTLCMVRLDSEQQIQTARSVLESMMPQLAHILPRCVQLHFTGVDNFRERLVYVKVAKSTALEKFVSCLIEGFQLAGLRTPGNHQEYTPHMTIVKMSRPMQRELHTSMISPSTYLPFQDMPVGSQKVDSLHLCSMTEPKQSDGFYKRLAHVQNSLSCYGEAISSLVGERVRFMSTQGVISEDQERRMLQSLEEDERKTGSNSFSSVTDDILKFSRGENSLADYDGHSVVVIMRGLPGSGKSFLTQHCSERNSVSSKVQICSADEYFEKNGTYKFDPALLPTAHSYCFQQFLSALRDKKRLVLIDNTNTMLWEYNVYFHVCEILGLQCHILEVPCPSDTVMDMYRSRNTHNIDHAVYSGIISHWEEDERASLVPPRLVFPSANPTERAQFSLSSLYDPDGDTKKTLQSCSALTAVYTGVFLTEESQWKLVSTFSPIHSRVLAHHITLNFEPLLESVARIGVGRKVTLRVVGCANNDKVQVVAVSLPKGVTSENDHPHITVSTKEYIPPRVANELLQSQSVTPVKDPKSITLEGFIGVVVREGSRNDDKANIATLPKIPITSSSDLKHLVMLKLDQDLPHTLPSLIPVDVSICTGTQEITQLFIFDFDHTLFDTPDPREGKQLYENSTGQKWPHKGWLSWPESLLPPLKVYPGPALPEYHSHFSRAGSVTVILTARIKRTEKAIQKILDNTGLVPDRLYLKPDSLQGGSPEFKASIVAKLLEEYPSVNVVKFWDDRTDNLAAIQRLVRKYPRAIQLETIDATTMSQVKASKHGKKVTAHAPVSATTHSDSVLEANLARYGCLPTEAYREAAVSGINFLTNQFCKVTDMKVDPNLITYSFGSFQLGRMSDIDMCLVHLDTISTVECMEKLADQLQMCGVKYIHKGYSSRCPRLKVMLEFTSSPAIDYDIIFAAVNKSFLVELSSRSEPLSPQSLIAYIDPADHASKTTLTGPRFLTEVQQAIKDAGISPTQFGAVVEMVVQVLSSQRQKGNAYHCIRTFHVVRLLTEFIKTLDSSVTTSCDMLFKSFVSYALKLPHEHWSKVFGEFVPSEFIPKIVEVFSLMNREVTSPDFPSHTCYDEMRSRPSFPPSGYATVQLNLSSSNKVLLWRLHTIVEARLPSYIRQLLTLGLDVVPDGNNSDVSLKFCFAVLITKSSKQTLQQVLRPFWNEISEYRNQPGVSVKLIFGAELQSKGTDHPSSGKEQDNGSKINDISEKISKFATSNEKILHLPSSMSSYERLLVYETTERLGLQHHNEGDGKDRHIVVSKTV